MNEKEYSLSRLKGQSMTFLAPYPLDTCFNLLQGMARPQKLFSGGIKVSFGVNATANQFTVLKGQGKNFEEVHGYLEMQSDQTTLVHLEKRSGLGSFLIVAAIMIIFVGILSISLISSGNFWGGVGVFIFFVLIAGAGSFFPMLMPSPLMQEIQRALSENGKPKTK